MRRLVPLLLLAGLLAPRAGLAGEAQPAASAGLQTASLRVATFNAWLIPLVSDDRRERLKRLPAALAGVEADVICLQEVWTGSDQVALMRGLSATHPHAVRGGGGLMILSRLPMLDSAWVRFPEYPGLSIPERLARKGLLEAVVRTAAGPVRVVTAHLALAFGEDNPREKQLAFLLRRLAKQRDLPLVLAADLNSAAVRDGRLTPEYRRLLGGGFVDANPPRRTAEGRYDPGPPTRIGWPRPEGTAPRGYYPDHVLYRPSPTARLRLRAFHMLWDDRATALSDHNLLCAHLQVTPLPPAAEDTK